MTVEVAIPTVNNILGEGPHWDDQEQKLLFVDILANKVYKWDPVTNKLDSITLEDTIGAVVPCKKGGYLVGLGRTVAHLDWSSQKVTKLQEIPLNGTKNRFNDAKCDPVGRFWTGSMGHQISQNPNVFEPEKGELYCYDTDGTLHKRVEKVGISNGLVWTQDNRTMYYIDTVPAQVYGFDYDVHNGTITNRRVVIDYENYDDADSMGHPDGMTSDVDGNLWIANWGFGKIICFDPNSGKKLRTVQIPAMRTTSCCFGGKNLDELYVTCAKQGATDEELAAYPMTGSIFRVTGLGTKGLPANVYEG
ncbi:regucalcin-like [Pecten maximus]|uniref:regucalcin-like n=1 Tax=Pecten maximus TaxID=6579 RepID=UPI001458A336|nr:regucalcin-like [Pecten maximus]